MYLVSRNHSEFSTGENYTYRFYHPRPNLTQKLLVHSERTGVLFSHKTHSLYFNVLIYHLDFGIVSAYATAIFMKVTPRLFEGVSL